MEIVMGFLNGLLGNASTVSVAEVKKEWGKILAQGEDISAAYKLIRDYIIFTPKRLILIDIQGITGRRIEIQSIPYRSILGFSIQTAGVMDLNAELFIWVANKPEPITRTFDKNVNIYEVQAILADAIAGD
jgi:hypothetical protein